MKKTEVKVAKEKTKFDKEGLDLAVYCVNNFLNLKKGVVTPIDTPVSQAYRKAVIGTPGFNGYDQALGNGKFAYEQEETSDINTIIKDLESELDPSTMDGRSGLLVLGKLRKRLKLN